MQITIPGTDRNRPTPPGKESYDRDVRVVAEYCGHEAEQKNFGQAVEFLNNNTPLQLDQFEQQVFKLLFTALGSIPRFGDDPHIEEYKGEMWVKGKKNIRERLDRY